MGFANAFQYFTSLIRPTHKLRLMDGMKGYLHERKLPPPTTLFRAARIDREAGAEEAYFAESSTFEADI